MSCNSLEVCNLYIVCMYILTSYSLSDSNNLEGDRALLQYSPTTIAIRNSCNCNCVTYMIIPIIPCTCVLKNTYSFSSFSSYNKHHDEITKVYLHTFTLTFDEPIEIHTFTLKFDNGPIKHIFLR